MPPGRVLLWLLPRRKVLAWRVAQKVDAGDTGFRLGREGTWTGTQAPPGLCMVGYTSFQAMFPKVVAFLCRQPR